MTSIINTLNPLSSKLDDGSHSNHELPNYFELGLCSEMQQEYEIAYEYFILARDSLNELYLDLDPPFQAQLSLAFARHHARLAQIDEVCTYLFKTMDQLLVKRISSDEFVSIINQLVRIIPQDDKTKEKINKIAQSYKYILLSINQNNPNSYCSGCKNTTQTFSTTDLRIKMIKLSILLCDVYFNRHYLSSHDIVVTGDFGRQTSIRDFQKLLSLLKQVIENSSDQDMSLHSLYTQISYKRDLTITE